MSGYNATITALVSNTISVVAKESDGTSRTVGGDFFYIHITDYCECAQSFLCVRVPSSNAKYVNSILPLPQILLFTDNGDGTYNQSFTINLKGYASMSIYLAKRKQLT